MKKTRFKINIDAFLKQKMRGKERMEGKVTKMRCWGEKEADRSEKDGDLTGEESETMVVC